ncbi:MAG: hypothetical protein J6M95_03815 [Bacilli bacterium]|nr:hypothetical protein [Bacilli bacterium]
MKKRFLIGMVLPLTAASFVVGCRPTSSGDKIDVTKTQIYINNFKRGFGSKWLDDLKTRFESLHAEDSYEEGKKGVEIIIHSIGSTADSRKANILSGVDEIYFTEQSYYYDLIKYEKDGVLYDITDAVKNPLTEYGETKSIEDKLTEEQKDYFYYQNEGGEKKYYALPHYAGYFGLQYDIDVFDNYMFYFAKNPISPEYPFIRDLTDEKTAGPDGVEGTFDDGLPRTYDEFFKLCDYMVENDVIPFISTGANANDYLNLLVNAFAADYAGKDNTVAKFKASGTVSRLGNVDSNGNVTPIPDETLTIDTGYRAYKSLGFYYGLEFLKKLTSNKNYYFRGANGSGGLDSSAYSAKSAQDEFLISYRDSKRGKSKDIAMISEGIWWEAESETTSETLSGGNPNSPYAKMNRHFGFMPFPKATMERYEESNKNTLFDHLFSLMFVKRNVASWKAPLLLDFMRFANTDESLRAFTRITNTPKSLNYTMTDEDKAQMTAYGRNLIELKENSDIVYPGNSSTIYQLNSGWFHHNSQYSALIDGVRNDYVWQALPKVSAATYYNGMYAYYSDYWKNLAK